MRRFPILLCLLLAFPALPRAQNTSDPSTAARPARPAQPAVGERGANQGAASRPPARPGPAAGARPGAQPPAKGGAAQPGAGSRRAPAAAAGVAAGVAAGAAAAPPRPEPPPEPSLPTMGAVTGLPLPRFAPLRSDEVNLRAGPGTRFRIEWAYRRRGLPVQILRENEQWRLIRDFEGTEGWVHDSNLGRGRRTFMVKGEQRTLRRRAEDGAVAVAKLEPGVIGNVRACGAGNAWCEVQIGEHRGWLQRDAMFGVTGDEVIGD